jgi:transposase
MAKRKRYTDEFKREAVGLTRQPGSSVSQVARDIGVNANQLWRWRREQDEHGSKAFTGPGTARDQEVLALKRELAKVKKERDFLRDAAAFFAKESS